MFGDRHPFAGSPDHYAAYLENDDGYEVEIVAEDTAAEGDSEQSPSDPQDTTS